MEKRRTFKTGATYGEIVDFTAEAAAELSLKPMLKNSPIYNDVPIPITITITVSTRSSQELVVASTVEDLGLDSVASTVSVWLDYRADELRKPVRSLGALRRMLKPFEGNPAAFREAVAESMTQGWTGLFARKTNGKSRKIEGGSDDGFKW
jgi:hypothetical protein